MQLTLAALENRAKAKLEEMKGDRSCFMKAIDSLASECQSRRKKFNEFIFAMDENNH